MSAAMIALGTGLLLSVYPTGRVLTRWAIPESNPQPGSRVLVALACGLAAWTVVLMGLGLLGLFHIGLWGTLAWLVVAASIWRNRRELATRAKSMRPDRDALVITGLTLLVACLYLGPAKESILGERDEGIYTQHALHLARTGASRIDLAAQGLVSNPQIIAINKGEAPEVPGIYPAHAPDTHWTFQFSAATPAWMAALVASAGPHAGLRFNALVGVLSFLAFLLLARRMLPERHRLWAIVAAAAFSLNPSAIWIARNTLSEPFAAWFTLCGLLTLVIPAERAFRVGVLGGALLGMATLVRIDAFIVVIAVPLAWMLAIFSGVCTRGSDMDRKFMGALIGVVGTSLLALTYFALFANDYLGSLGNLVTPLLAASAVATTAALTLRRAVPADGWHGIRKWLSILLPAMALSTFAYAAWVRPALEPFALIQSELVPQLNGMRDHREDSLRNAAGYLSWPVVFVAAIGVAAWLRATFRGKIAPEAFMPLAIILPLTAVYLWNPMISPDHIWASRRWIPGVFPGLALFAAIGAATLVHRAPRHASPALACVAAIALTTSLLVRQKDTLWFAEDAGLIRHISAIADYLPGDRTSFVLDNAPLASALLAGAGAKVVPVQTATPGRITTSELAALGCDLQQSCSVIHPAHVVIDGVGARPIARGTLTRPQRNKSTTAPAQGTHVTNFDYFITRVGG